MIDDSLKWESTVKCIQTEIFGAIGILKDAKHNVQEDTLTSMRLSTIQLHCSYCYSVSGYCGITKLKTLQ